MFSLSFSLVFRAAGGGNLVEEAWMDFISTIRKTSPLVKASFGLDGEAGIIRWRRRRWWSSLLWDRSTQSQRPRVLRLQTLFFARLFFYRGHDLLERSLIIYSCYFIFITKLIAHKSFINQFARHPSHRQLTFFSAIH